MRELHLAQVIQDAPWVSPTAARIRRDHQQIAGDLAHVATQLSQPGSPAEHEACRTAARAVLDRAARHRGAAGDLVHEAHQIDIGGR
jgi:uncharacterized membrane protein YccC